MTPVEYQQAISRFQSGNLNPGEAAYYRIAGIIAETRARNSGTSLLPFPWQTEHPTTTEINPEVLIAIGLTSLAFQTDPCPTT